MAVAPTYTSSPVQIGPSVAMVFQGATTGQVLGPILLSQLIEYHQHNWSWALLFFSVLAVTGGLLMSQVRSPECNQQHGSHHNHDRG
jgi:MFS family permease